MQQTNSLLKDCTVVIADDDDIAREMLRATLGAAGLRIVGEATDGAQALDLYRKLKPEIVCLDIDMPIATGIETLISIRENDTQTIVLMVTGVATGENVRTAITARANGIVVKPFNREKITSDIERAIMRQQGSTAAVK